MTVSELERHHGLGFIETTAAERARSYVGWNDWRLMAALLRKAGYAVTEPVAAQNAWRPMASAPRVSRVLVGYECGVVEISRQWNCGEDGWCWVSDDGDRHDPSDDPIIGWMPLPPSALRLRADCTCYCHGPDGRLHELPCCRGTAAPVRAAEGGDHAL